MRDVRWLDQRSLDLLLEDEGKALAPCPVLLNSKTGGLGGSARFFIGLDAQEIDACRFLHRIRHGHALERTLEGQCLVAERDIGGAMNRGCQMLEQALDQRHHVLIISIGPVALHHGEFRIVPGGNAFVAEGCG